MPAARAACSHASAIDAAPCPSPAVRIIAAAVPLAAAARTTAATAAGGTAMTATSGVVASAS
jgi:hypothetical protein